MSFIKLNRKIIDSEVFAHDGQFRFWIWLLTQANYKTRFAAIKIGAGQSTVEVKRGELIFGRNSASSILNVKPATLYVWLQKFKEMKMVELKSNKHFTIVTICKYEEYQTADSDKLATDSQPDSNQLATVYPPFSTPKEIQERKEVKEYLSNGDFDFNKTILNFGANEILLSKWIDIRAKRNGKNTERAFDDFITQVKQSGADINEALQMCVDNKWVGFKADWYAKKKAIPLDFDNDERIKHLLSTKKSENFVEIAIKSKFTLPELMVIVLKKLANKENREYFSVMSEINNAQSIAKIIEGKRKTIDEQILMFANMVFAASNDEFWSGKITMAAINKNINNFAKYLEA